MQYICYTISVVSQNEAVATEDVLDYLAVVLADIGFDSFEHQACKLLAYIPKDLHTEEIINSTLFEELPFQGLSWQYSYELMPDVNWNEEWEKNYFQPIIIGDNLCQIRAPFHEANSEVQTEVIISPKMAFGTGNHETTALMMSYILEQDMQELRVLDMGCGTGILGILALKQGATSLVAIDIDEWAYLNVLENATLNAVKIDKALQGDASSLAGIGDFDLILANITRNILLEDMQVYVSVLANGGTLVLSGFYEADAEVLIAEGERLGLSYVSIATRNNWARLDLRKS